MTGLERSVDAMLGSIATALSREYSLDESSVYETLRRTMSVRVAVRGEGRARKSETPRAEKPAFALPWCGSYREGWCQGIRPQHGLFSQCVQAPGKDGLYCATCSKKGHPTAEERSSLGWSAEGKRPIRYANYLAKKGIQTDRAREEAAKFGVDVPDSEYVV